MANAEVNAYTIYNRHQLIWFDNYIQYGNKILKAVIGRHSMDFFVKENVDCKLTLQKSCSVE